PPYHSSATGSTHQLPNYTSRPGSLGLALPFAFSYGRGHVPRGGGVMRLIAIKPLTILAFTVGAFPVNTVLAQMDHSEMQMQGGSAPADARDPHTYSDGYTLTEGPYAQPGQRQLKLADEHAFWS